MNESREKGPAIPRFERDAFRAGEIFTRIGKGEIGGKAKGLRMIRDTLTEAIESDAFAGVQVSIPRLTVVTTDVFERYMEQNDLWEVALSSAPDERIAHAFQAAELPTTLVGDLKALMDEVHAPLAVRSSSLLEDALYRPFAGVYGTKMIPNASPDPAVRFRELSRAIKFVWASTFFRAAKAYIRATEQKTRDERMAVIIQEVVGRRHGERFYPDISGVARSYDFYPAGRGKPKDGVVNLALGLGKTIVDGGLSWSYSPARPAAPPPFGSVDDQLKNTQLRFFAINMGPPLEDDPLREDEHLLDLGLNAAEVDGCLRHVASTLDPRSGRLSPGTAVDGPRVVNFAPILVLRQIPLNEIVKTLLEASERAVGAPVEIEFAVTIDTAGSKQVRFGFLQVRPMVVSDETVEISPESLEDDDVLVASDRVMGNGEDRRVRDVVYVRRQSFEARHTRAIAQEIERINTQLLRTQRPYVLIGFGRWGSSDPWLGIPVNWGQICGARAIVEATLPEMNVDPSQGSHFFHNISSFRVSYFSLHHELGYPINWERLDALPAESETKLVRHVRLPAPLEIRVDGRTGRGGIWLGDPQTASVEPPAPPAFDVPEPARDRPIQTILAALQERAKELNCLYRVDEILSAAADEPAAAFQALVDALPPGWQYPDICKARLVVGEQAFTTPGFVETEWVQRMRIVDQGESVGEIEVFYTEPKPHADEGPFLAEERKLINTIAERIGYFVMQQRLRGARESWTSAVESIDSPSRRQWAVILDFLRRTDQDLLLRITRKMINYLCWSGVSEADALLGRFSRAPDPLGPGNPLDENIPLVRQELGSLASLTTEAFEIASRHLSEDEIIERVQSWIQEDRTSFLTDTLESQGSSFPEISNALERYHSMRVDEAELPEAILVSHRVSLIRRFFTDQLDFINVAKHFVDVGDFHELTSRVISPAGGHGKLGGKSAGLFLASRVAARAEAHRDLLGQFRVPKTWYITSDGLMSFIRHNNLDDVHARKYMEIDQIRREYPHLIQIFKNSHFPPEIISGLSVALDDLEDRPLIVRSSSLLEDRFGSSFSGKYKSLFLANQGSKRERLAALCDAIAEVYASTFGPDPIEYRAERNLLDVHEEMGIMIQEVVGQRVGDYYLPAFAGVAFSNNELRWSPRIRRRDGLLRLVPGLGTRAVDRLGDDYPILITPGQPGLRVNATPDEVVRYSPRMIDLIDLKTNSFKTVDIDRLLAEVGASYPSILRLVSVVDSGQIRRPSGLILDFEKQKTVISFEGLLTGTRFVERMRVMLEELEAGLGTPVDVEFASDGQDLFLLQCRPQSYSMESAPAPIPRDIPKEKVLFSARRFVSNGRVPDLTHLVYVDGDAYDALEDLAALKKVGRTVGMLNKRLPKRQFALIGPGRWGTRGDIKLGVSVGYSDVNNAAMLIEVARSKGGYVPDLSFGTHFFQDLVEAGIRYLPLYPDDEGVVFEDGFFSRAPNLLETLVPESAELAAVVRVVDVRAATGGQVLRVLLNADLDEAVALFVGPSRPMEEGAATDQRVEAGSDEHWRWRAHMARDVARNLDADRFGVRAVYVFGSTKNATAGPGSDIDLIIHDEGDERRELLELWLEGWSRSLAEMNYLRTGYRSDGLLDVHFVTDADIAGGDSFAAKIGAVTDPAQLLPLGPED